MPKFSIKCDCGYSVTADNTFNILTNHVSCMTFMRKGWLLVTCEICHESRKCGPLAKSTTEELMRTAKTDFQRLIATALQSGRDTGEWEVKHQHPN